MGLLHAGIMNTVPGCELQAICDSDSMICRWARKVIPGVRFYTRLAEMLEKESLDSVHVTTPAWSHQSVIIDLFNYDKVNVFCEKPLALDYAQALSIANLARAHSGETMVGYQKRFCGTFEYAHKILEEGVLGELTKFTSHFYTNDVTRASKGPKFSPGTGGVSIDFMPHLVDLLLWYFGRPKWIDPIAKRIVSKEVEDSVHATLGYDYGLAGTLDVSWSAPGFNIPELAIEVHGLKGQLRVTEDTLEMRLVNSKANSRYESGTFYAHALTATPNFLISRPELALEDEYFVECIRHGSQPRNNFVQASEVNLMIDEIRKKF